MKKTLIGISASLAIMAGGSFYASAQAVPDETAAVAQTPQPIIVWEYYFLDGQFTKKVKLLSTKYEDDLAATTELGLQGWELVTVLPKTKPGGAQTEYYFYIFKRPKK